MNENFWYFLAASALVTLVVDHLNHNHRSKISYSAKVQKIYESSDIFEMHMIQSPLTVLDKYELDTVHRVIDNYKKHNYLNSKYIKININGKTLDFMLNHRFLQMKNHEQIVFNIF